MLISKVSLTLEARIDHSWSETSGRSTSSTTVTSSGGTLNFNPGQVISWGCNYGANEVKGWINWQARSSGYIPVIFNNLIQVDQCLGFNNDIQGDIWWIRFSDLVAQACIASGYQFDPNTNSCLGGVCSGLDTNGR